MTETTEQLFNSSAKVFSHTPLETHHDMANDKLDRLLSESLTTSTIIGDVRNLVSGAIPLTTNVDFKKSNIEFTSDNKSEKIQKYLNDTLLPSRSQLNESDPFSQITSNDYLLYFALGASVALFALNLFN